MSKRSDPPFSAEETQPSSRSEFRKAPQDVNRIPGSAASMKVLERSKKDSPSSKSLSLSNNSGLNLSCRTSASSSSTSSCSISAATRNRNAIQAMQPFLDTTTTADSPIQPTDIQLLTTSILSNQERQRVILFYQEKLIESQPPTSLEELKKSLLFLSSSSWGQILEERTLANKCAYPSCANPSPSIRTKRGDGGVAKYKINLRDKSVKAVEDLNLGEAGNTWDDLKHAFCSKPCYARSEWILRWVLEDKEVGFADQNTDRGGGSTNKLDGERGNSVLGGGKWQKLTNHPGGWQDIELLEDMERESGVRLEDVEHDDTNGIGDILLEGVKAKDNDDDDRVSSRVRAGEHDRSAEGASEKNVSNLMGFLTIVERPKASPFINSATITSARPGNNVISRSSSSVPPTSSTIQPAVAKIDGMSEPTIISNTVADPCAPMTTTTKTRTTPLPSRMTYDVDVPNSLGSRFDVVTNDITSSSGGGRDRFGPGRKRSTDSVEESKLELELDFETELDQRERELSHILRFASMASGSRPGSRNNNMIRFENANDATVAPLSDSVSRSGRSVKQKFSGLVDGQGDSKEEKEEEGAVIAADPKVAVERSELNRLMDFAMNVRRDQIQLGLL
ncbi:uncharacterized protein MEPE_06039 [Melanopsichium pennsylvanicum]|uniref:RNA polymerase II subunit B1 CTD phosphatase RPAP2 homolog n=1 Tax=Melanopsichium pennsylvanicum TaxID=63383 RepID=A0AAJ5C8B5_9BASI|nr:uncharacterized protein MEPE_06039 [Melanopsichium pennsylvanicum]